MASPGSRRDKTGDANHDVFLVLSIGFAGRATGRSLNFFDTATRRTNPIRTEAELDSTLNVPEPDPLRGEVAV